MSNLSGKRRPPLQIRVTKEFGTLIDSAIEPAVRRGVRDEERDAGRAPAARALILIGAAALGRDIRPLRAEIYKALSIPLAPDVAAALYALLEGTELPAPQTTWASAEGWLGELEPDERAAPDEPDPFDVGQEF